MPFVATKCAAYTDFERYGKVVENTPEAWYKALKSRVDNLDHFYQEALAARSNNLKRLTIENNAQRLVDLYFQIGEETQALDGMVFPDMLQLAANPETKWDGPNPILYEGDPLEIGQADYAQLTIDLAKTWDDDLGLYFENWNIGDLIEYTMLTHFNTQLGKDTINAN